VVTVHPAFSHPSKSAKGGGRALGGLNFPTLTSTHPSKTGLGGAPNAPLGWGTRLMAGSFADSISQNQRSSAEG
jgi:hypothetical protein